MSRSVLSAVVLTMIACASGDDGIVTPKIVGAPTKGTVLMPTTVALPSTPVLLAAPRGQVVVGVRDGLFRANVADGALAPITIVAQSGEPSVVGTPIAVSSRGSDGWFVLSDRGLFHDAFAALMPSPASAPILAAGARTISATGASQTETLWIATRDGASVWRAGNLTPIAISGAGVSGKIEHVVGIDDHRALLASGGTLWECDTQARSISQVAMGTGIVASSARGDDGAIYLATTTGLWSRAKDGTVRQRTFAAEGELPRKVRDVSTSFDTVAALVDNDLVVWDGGSGPRIVGTTPAASSVALDVNGDAWTLSQAPSGLQKFATGKPVSFDRDVKPFFIKHCQTCHATGASGAPIRAFDQFDVAKDASVEIAKRLRGDGRPVMPPSATRILQPSEYRVVLRWQASGMSL